MSRSMRLGLEPVGRPRDRAGRGARAMDGLLSEDTSSFEAAGLSGLVADCERFEAMWRDGGAPRIEAFLEGVAPSRRRRLLCELLAIEIELRAVRGEAPMPGEYFRRNPDWAEAVAKVFARETFESRRTEHPSQPTACPPGPDGGAADGNGPAGSAMDNTVEALRDAPPPISPSEPLPERFGRYPVIALLGHGGFGRVYLRATRSSAGWWRSRPCTRACSAPRGRSRRS